MVNPQIQELDLLHTHICRAFSDPKRMLILYKLHEQPQHGSALAEALDLPQPTVSRHLRLLHRSGLVFTERDGPAVIYHLADARLIEVLDTMRSVLRDALERQSQKLP